jgi:hypothetical protein
MIVVGPPSKKPQKTYVGLVFVNFVVERLATNPSLSGSITCTVLSRARLTSTLGVVVYIVSRGRHGGASRSPPPFHNRTHLPTAWCCPSAKRAVKLMLKSRFRYGITEKLSYVAR